MKKCTKCSFVCDKVDLVKYFGYRMWRNKQWEQPQCRWCRNGKINPYTSVTAVGLLKELPNDLAIVREIWKREYPNDKQSRTLKRMQERLVKNKGYVVIA